MLHLKFKILNNRQNLGKFNWKMRKLIVKIDCSTNNSSASQKGKIRIGVPDI